jgi:hypothetical protein
MDKARLLELWLRDLAFKKQCRALGYRLKYGKFAGKTLKELFQTTNGLRYVLWLKNHTKNDRFKQILINSARAELKMM